MLIVQDPKRKVIVLRDEAGILYSIYLGALSLRKLTRTGSSLLSGYANRMREKETMTIFSFCKFSALSCCENVDVKHEVGFLSKLALGMPLFHTTIPIATGGILERSQNAPTTRVYSHLA
ncbi:hypothetical protein HDU67_006946 [Dinochytrium kinnereticum]|nr:hypothetical protein HDU67_006946 [Dinochytrium kinnereticum]